MDLLAENGGYAVLATPIRRAPGLAFGEISRGPAGALRTAAASCTAGATTTA